jgi:hypothetical protein
MKGMRAMKWKNILLIILSLQMLNYSFVLPYVVAHTSAKEIHTASKDAVLAHALDDLFHLGNLDNTGQDEIPLDAEDLGVEKNVETYAIPNLKKEYLLLGILHLQFILYNNKAASIYQPELITPPPKLA